MVATRDIPAGAVVMKATPFSTAVEDNLKKYVCSHCFVSSLDKHPIHCNRCNEVWYCSTACQERASVEHALFECTYFRRIRVLGDSLELDSDGYTELKVVLHVLTKMVYLKKKEEKMNAVSNVDLGNYLGGENNTMGIDGNNTNENNNSNNNTNKNTINNSHTNGNVNSSNSEYQPSFKESYTDIFHLVSNQEHINEVARAFINDLQSLVSKVMGKYIHSAFPGVEAYDIVDIICRQRCNRFGIWSKKDKCLGIAVSPAASFFNHSCVPNCAHEQEGKVVIIRTLHAVPKDAELAISYISLQQDTAKRHEELLGNYHFKCGCIRCTENTEVYDKWLENFYCVGNHCQSLIIPSKNDNTLLCCTYCGFERQIDTTIAPPGLLP